METEIRPSPEPVGGSWIRSRSGIVFLLFAAVAVYFLLTEHRAHFIQALPWLFVLACPLMHFFHHGGHGSHHGGGDR